MTLIAIQVKRIAVSFPTCLFVLSDSIGNKDWQEHLWIVCLDFFEFRPTIAGDLQCWETTTMSWIKAATDGEVRRCNCSWHVAGETTIIPLLP